MTEFKYLWSSPPKHPTLQPHRGHNWPLHNHLLCFCCFCFKKTFPDFLQWHQLYPQHFGNASSMELIILSSFFTCFLHSPVGSWGQEPHLTYLCISHVSAWHPGGLYICLTNEWISNKTQNKIMGAFFFFLFHTNSYFLRGPSLHSASPQTYCLNWHSFLQVQWRSQIWMVWADENFLSSRTNRRNNLLHLWEKLVFS